MTDAKEANRRRTLSILLILLAGALVAFLIVCRPFSSEATILRLATTTSVENSGLLDAILPDFESGYGVEVDVIAVGTGQALALGELGDVDAVLVHAPSLEEDFVAAGHGTERYPVAYNDFVLVGPPDDPAAVGGAPDAADALSRIVETGALFASRGDNSGTHVREIALWQAAGLEPTPDQGWYLSLGQGMGSTLNAANEQGAYTLTDRGTYLTQSENLPNLAILFGGDSAADNPDPGLLNYYSVIPVDPQKHSQVNYELAMDFVAWLTSLTTQERIGALGVGRFGQPLFYPDSEAWRAAGPD